MDDGWRGKINATDPNVRYDFGSPVKIENYRITAQNWKVDMTTPTTKSNAITYKR